jgi:hypothetical protein
MNDDVAKATIEAADSRHPTKTRPERAGREVTVFGEDGSVLIAQDFG